MEKRTLDLPVEAVVQCADGACGRLVRTVVNPINDEVTHIVVEEDAFPNTTRLVPIRLVLGGGPHTVTLACTKQELAEQEVFSETEFIPTGEYGSPLLLPYTVPAVPGVILERERVPAGELALRRGARVEALDGAVGRVDEFIVDPGRYHITHLLLRAGHLWAPKEISIPVADIDSIRENTVYLKKKKAEIEALPGIQVRRRWP